MYMYIYICMYIYTHMHIYIHIDTYLYMYVYIYTKLTSAQDAKFETNIKLVSEFRQILIFGLTNHEQSNLYQNSSFMNFNLD